MAEQEQNDLLPSMSHSSSATNNTTSSHISIPPALKFLLNNIKNLAPHQLTPDNYAIWRTQLLQQFTANGYAGYLTGAVSPPPDEHSTDYARWHLEDSNLLSALYSTISQQILPYILTSSTSHEAWQILERRLQPTCRSRVIQLKNELHNVRLKDLTIPQYLTQIKSIVDNIAAAGSKIEPDDVIHYILQGLPNTYSSFKTAIRTYPQSLDLDKFYSLLCSEAINIQQEQSLDLTNNTPHNALYASSQNSSRDRTQRRFFKNKNSAQPYNSNNNSSQMAQPASNPSAKPTCQICGKIGHIALNCWHRCNLKFAPTVTRPPKALLAQTPSSNSHDWVLDTGATSHLTHDGSYLHSPSTYQGNDSVSVANGSTVPIQHTGQGLLPLPETSRKLYLNNLLHVPSLTHNLLSVSKLTQDNAISITFYANGFDIKDIKDQRPLLRGRLHNGLYQISMHPESPPKAYTATTTSIMIWHARLGHPHNRLLPVLANSIPELQNLPHSFTCISCNMAKSHKQKFNKSSTVTSSPFDLIHTDVWGPAPLNSTDGQRYYIIFIDDFTRYSWLYLMHTKSEALTKFKSFCALVQTQFHTTPKILRSDGGGEFTGHEFKAYLQDSGITQQLSCPHTPEQNGVSERKHRHILDLTRALLHESHLPNRFWAEALSTAHYLINLLPSKPINLHSPYQRLHGQTPTYTHLRVFGCLCFPWLKPYTTSKLSPRSTPCTFLGYSPLHKGYKCFDPQTDKMYISRHVIFHETIFPHKSTTSPSTSPIPSSDTFPPPLLLVPTSTNSCQHTTNQLPTTQHTTTHQNSTNSSTNISSLPHAPAPSNTPSPSTISTNTPQLTPHPSHPMVTRLKSGITKPKHILNLLSHTSVSQIPKNYKQAITQPHWLRAMSEEYQALQRQHTWTLVSPPTDKPILSSKWTYKIKTLPSGQIDRYKARLVALGYDQEFGINFTETFSPVAKMTTIRVLLTLALHRQWPIFQLDVSNAFLHGDLHDDIYMYQPPGFEDKTRPNDVCKLQKSLYGLKQAPRQWFQKLTTFLQSKGFGFSRSDPSLLLFQHNNIFIYILIYVDDFLVTGNNPEAIQNILQQLRTQFSLKQLGTISLFLGIQVHHQQSGYFLTQEHYATKILQEAGMTDCKPAPTPVTPTPKHPLAESPPFHNPALYRKLAGSLQYLSITRPDIAFATNHICQHMHRPTDRHFQDLKRLLRYIKGTTSYGLPITPGQLTLTTYTDADWASDHTDRKSVSGFCSYLGNTLISWTVKKQQTVAKSTTEAEYRSLSAAVSEVLWLRRLAHELRITQHSPTTIYCDNISAIAIAKNPVFHARTKHIEIDFHFTRQHIEDGNIIIEHISSANQVADALTKALPIQRFNELRTKLTIRQPNG
ncbi:Retrovirus-related Pol polyprotein from transposon TNT 1-94 [Dendrobium catenatum]|uniref:Retrovirus-related Pol polyprotein from transposon TNT 1-94 n=1 Tax=Dendrobium catenatum TaxID=906689 RepID=A0A2I0W5Q7_9ASPA|nr:Retrovirus-related Pol polyprotein from transposon TNT 1-94 [Dendrobium catenatum]